MCKQTKAGTFQLFLLPSKKRLGADLGPSPLVVHMETGFNDCLRP
jgi:hypothetical protein